MSRRIFARGMAAIAAALVLALVRTPARADQPDTGLSKKALALNDITGESAIDGEIRRLVKDPAASKQLLKTAVAMVSGKEQPFSYNAAHILARVADNLKDPEDARIFYRVCVDEANKLGSAQKITISYNGLMSALLRLHKEDEAGKLIREILDLPDDDRRLMGLKMEMLQLVARSFVTAGKVNDGLKIGDDLIKARPKDWRAYQTKLMVLRLAGQFDKAEALTKQVFDLIKDSEDLKPDAKAGARGLLIASFLEAGKPEIAINLAEKAVKDEPNDWRALRQQAEVLDDAKQSDKAVKVYDKLLALVGKDQDISTDQKNEIRESAAMAYARAGQSDKALDVVQKAVADDASDWRARETEGLVLQEIGRPEDATKAYQQMLDLLSKDQNVDEDRKTVLMERGRYILSGAYLDANQLAKATEILQTLLNAHPDNASYNNDLGYIWADHDMHLEQAEKMIRKAVETDRKAQARRGAAKGQANAAYLDSLGWVLYKEKKPSEAVKYLEEAVQDKDEGQHVEILDHLADVYMALGQKDKAVSTWKQAVKVAGKTRRERERKAIVEKKLKENEK